MVHSQKKEMKRKSATMIAASTYSWGLVIATFVLGWLWGKNHGYEDGYNRKFM